MKDQQQQPHGQEMGQWVGYEESYDPQTRTWGPSNVSCLTFKSLINLRRTLTTGVVILDCEEQTLANIAEKMVDELVNKSELRPEDRDGVLESLLHNQTQSTDPEMQALTVGVEVQIFSVKDRREGSDCIEASMVLVGALDFLEKDTVAFVRLKEAVVLDLTLEAPLPVRFVFVLVGPGKVDVDYQETGHAMAALLADKVFNQAAFQAQEVSELHDAMATFMDCCIVIPPTEIQNGSMLSSIISFQKKLLQDRLQPSDPLLELKPRTSEL